MSEYPKRCTMEEAIACVKAGGKAEFCGTGDPTIIKIRKTKSGKVFHGFTRSTNRRYSDDFCRGWIYQITKPAPVADQSATRTYTTAEAVAEVLRSGEEMVGNRAGTSFTLRLDFGGDIVCDYDNDSSSYIPVSGVKWTKKKIAKPDAFSGDVTLPKGAAMTAPVNDICAMQSNWPGKVRVQWTVEAVD